MTLAHGMARDEVAADWPALSIAELAPVLARYADAGPPRAVGWHSARPFAAGALVACEGGTVFVKRHDPRVRSVADLGEEHAFMAHLRRRGVPVPAVLRAADGSTAVARPGGTYEVHGLAAGEDRYRDAHSWTPARSTGDAEAIGAALGRLHMATAGFAAPARRTRLLVGGDSLLRAPDLLAALQARVAADGLLGAALQGRCWQRDSTSHLLGWHAALQPHMAALAPLWAHGDLHASNLFWREGEVSAVADFGLCNRASAAYDLAVAIERNAVGWLEAAPLAYPDMARALLRGYDAAYVRSGAEMRALRHLLPLVHLDFALSELAYFHGVTRSAANAELAYSGFLLGHADWFGSPEGRVLLNVL